jgi:hypothetical protein
MSGLIAAGFVIDKPYISISLHITKYAMDFKE